MWLSAIAMVEATLQLAMATIDVNTLCSCRSTNLRTSDEPPTPSCHERPQPGGRVDGGMVRPRRVPHTPPGGGVGKPHEVGTTELPHNDMCVKSRQTARPFGIFRTSASCTKASCRQRQSGCRKVAPMLKKETARRDSKCAKTHSRTPIWTLSPLAPKTPESYNTTTM